MFNVFVWLLVGALSGWIATLITGARLKILFNLVVGIVGAFLGGWLIGPLFGFSTTNVGFSITGLLISLLGAVVLLLITKPFLNRQQESSQVDSKTSGTPTYRQPVARPADLPPVDKVAPNVLRSEPIPTPPTKNSPASSNASEQVQTPAPAVKESEPSLFISYRRDDAADVAGRIYDRLVQQFGETAVFKDIDSIPFGVDFRKHLADSVGRCSALLVVIGRQWVTITNQGGQRRLEDPRDFVRIELETALKRDIPIIPLFVQGATMPSEEDLPESLRELTYRNGVSIRPDPDFHRDMTRLIEGIVEYFKQIQKQS